MIIFQQMLIFFIMIILGVIAGKIGIINKENQQQWASMLVNITMPAIVLSGAFSGTERLAMSELLSAGERIILFIGVMVLFAELLSRLLHFNKIDQGAVSLSFIISNLMFIGMPLISNIYGSGALIYVVLFMIPLNLVFYTYGIIKISKGNPEGNGKIDLRRLLNPGVIASIVTIILYFLNIQMPSAITTCISMVGNMTGPLGMMVLGASLLTVDFKTLFKDIKLVIFTVVNMIVFPVAILLLFKVFTNNEQLLATFYVAVATPVGSMVPMLSVAYNPQSSETATKIVALTTIVSLVTMPLVSLLTGVC